MNRRIAFLDIDGTILDHGERIAPSTIDAVRHARDNGHLVYLCTGRGRAEINAAVRDIGFDGTISAGGGFAEIGDELVISRALPEEAVLAMIGFYEESGYDFYLQSYDEVYPSPGVAERFRSYLHADLADRTRGSAQADSVAVPPGAFETELRAFEDVRPYGTTGIAKSVFLGSDETAFDRVAAHFQGVFHVVTGTIPHLGRGSGEVTSHGVNKGSTILLLLELLGSTAENAIGIGDSGNDIEMLQLCGVGIAMGNAAPEIKAIADETTTSVLDDGVWNAFRRHGLI